jgi:hypothetical protein
MDTRYSKAVVADALVSLVPSDMDLVEECSWEEHASFITLEEAGFEEEDGQPIVGGLFDEGYHANGSVLEYVEWFYDGELELGAR